jgi:hypothetical protein
VNSAASYLVGGLWAVGFVALVALLAVGGWSAGARVWDAVEERKDRK